MKPGSPHGGRGHGPIDGRQGAPGAVLIAAAASLGWLALCAALWLAAPGTPAEDGGAGRLWPIIALLCIGLPLGLIWASALAFAAIAALRDETERLADTVEGLRKAALEARQSPTAMPAHGPRSGLSSGPPSGPPSGAVSGPRRGAMPGPARPAAASPRAPMQQPGPEGADVSARQDAPALPDQPDLALGGPSGPRGPGLGTADFIRALNFPETVEDRDGFRALRRALADRESARLVRAAQDALTLLSQEGLYMDDLPADRAHPDLWRRFAGGERGESLSQLGGIRAPGPLARVTARMRADPIFRDTAHHFLRQFDRRFADFADQASDAEIAALAETRTARAFMLLGRVTGMFG